MSGYDTEDDYYNMELTSWDNERIQMAYEFDYLLKYAPYIDEITEFENMEILMTYFCQWKTYKK
jgi:hypothetical protein